MTGSRNCPVPPVSPVPLRWCQVQRRSSRSLRRRNPTPRSLSQVPAEKCTTQALFEDRGFSVRSFFHETYETMDSVTIDWLLVPMVTEWSSKIIKNHQASSKIIKNHQNQGSNAFFLETWGFHRGAREGSGRFDEVPASFGSAWKCWNCRGAHLQTQGAHPVLSCFSGELMVNWWLDVERFAWNMLETLSISICMTCLYLVCTALFESRHPHFSFIFIVSTCNGTGLQHSE